MAKPDCSPPSYPSSRFVIIASMKLSVAEWLACWTQAQKGPGSKRSRDAVIGKLFTSIVPLFTKQRNW